MITRILNDGVDVLGLCEVSLEDAKSFEASLGPLGYGVMYAVDPVGTTRFDMALIYRMSKVACRGGEPWTVAFGRATFRTGYPVEVATSDAKSFYLVMCHWPGRRFHPAQSKNRDRVAIDMRMRLMALIKGGVRNIVLMGDFNDEPFNSNMSQILHALRDRTSAANGSDLFYNPFWNFLGSAPPFQHGSITPSRSGTHYYKLDHTECWWTFDQIIFSSSFLSGGVWRLDEAATALWETPELLQRLKKNGRFDHLPVISRILEGAHDG